MDFAFHRSEADIEVDLEYYFSEQRDKHNQIRPSDDIRSLTPSSELLTEDPGKDAVGNVFFPFAAHSLDRIFIGISFPLYANNFGAATLRYLLEIIRPDGAVILPVYPEVQALDKGLWCRTALENIFRSRTRFTGISNIWAENDGVMSMRVGRRWPPVIPSIARWLFREQPRSALGAAFGEHVDHARARWLGEIQRFWRVAQRQACIEQIIRDHFGRKRPVRLGVFGEDAGLLAAECLYSLYMRVTHATAIGSLEADEKLLVLYLACGTRDHGTLELMKNMSEHFDVLINCSANSDNPLLPQLKPGGLYIETPEVERPLAEGSVGQEIKFYSSRVAQCLQDGVTIHHYATHIEEEIAKEAETREGVFRVTTKS